MSRIGMLTFRPSDQGKNFVSNKRNTKHSRVRQKHSTRAPAGLPRVEHQTQNAARNHMSNQKLKSLTSHKATETNQVQRRPPQSHGILRFTKKTPKKKQYNECNQTQDAAVEAVGPITMFLNCAHLQSKLHRRAYWGFNANWSRVAKPPCNLPLNFSYDIFFGQRMFGRLHPILRSLG